VVVFKVKQGGDKTKNKLVDYMMIFFNIISSTMLIYFLIFSLSFVVFGAFMAYLGIRDLIRAKASVAWPTSPGKVLSSSVVQERGRDSEGGHLTYTYHAEVVYEFNVNNTTFSGNRVSYGDLTITRNNPSHAQEIVNCYPQDKNVTVSYMPNNPKECLLEVGVKGHAFCLPVFGLLCFTVGILVAVGVTSLLLELCLPVFGLLYFTVGILVAVFVTWGVMNGE